MRLYQDDGGYETSNGDQLPYASVALIISTFCDVLDPITHEVKDIQLCNSGFLAANNMVVSIASNVFTSPSEMLRDIYGPTSDTTPQIADKIEVYFQATANIIDDFAYEVVDYSYWTYADAVSLYRDYYNHESEDSNWCAIELHDSMENKVECLQMTFNYYSYLDIVLKPGYRENYDNQISIHHAVGFLICSHDGIYCTNASIYKIQYGGPLLISVNNTEIHVLGIQFKYTDCDEAYNHALIINYFMYNFFKSFSQSSS